MDAVVRGVTYFEELTALFKDNFKELAPVWIKSKGVSVDIKEEKDIQNMHEAFIQELKVTFSAALGKDRLYNRPCGFLNDQ